MGLPRGKPSNVVARRVKRISSNRRVETVHELLGGGTVDLHGLDTREQGFLRDLRKMARERISYFEVYRAAVGPGSPALQGRNRIDRQIVQSPLYLAARDIATRVGIEQGLVLAPEQANARVAAPADASMISVAQAADLIGITRAAVYKAIEKGTLRSIRIGNVTVVERASALAYRDRRGRENVREPRLPRAAGTAPDESHPPVQGAERSR